MCGFFSLLRKLLSHKVRVRVHGVFVVTQGEQRPLKPRMEVRQMLYAKYILVCSQGVIQAFLSDCGGQWLDY